MVFRIELALLAVLLGRPALPDARGGDAVDMEVARDFWAYRQLAVEGPPADFDFTWARTDMDRFIEAGWREQGLPAVAEDATPRVRLRRVYFDLIGLPPDQDALLAFEADPSPEALVRVVDELLGRPQFGETWGRHWLDLARYADSNGGDINFTYYNAWRYRNYVIDSFNKDKPYPQFIREQIAGDLLPSDTDAQRAEQLTGSGFLMLGPKMLSERDKEKMRMDIADEQLDTVGRVFLASTLGCARCHDHKFDPVPTRDYYAMAGIFRSTETGSGIRMNNVVVNGWVEQELPMSPEETASFEALRATLSVAEKQKKEAAALLSKLKKGERDVPFRPSGIVIDDREAEFTGEWIESQHVPSYIGKSYRHDNKLDKGAKSATFRAVIPEAGRYEVRLSYTSDGQRARNVPVRIRSGANESRVFLDETQKPSVGGLFESVGEFDLSGEIEVVITTEGTDDHYVIVDAVQVVAMSEIAEEKRKLVERAPSELGERIAAVGNEIKEMDQRIAALKKEIGSAPAVMAPRDAKDAADAAICIRGEPGQHGEVVPRGFLQVLAKDGAPAIAAGESGRRELAEWIAAPGNALAARVMVNRVWGHLFGEGLVRSMDNFGMLGEKPSHPALLGYLARRFGEQEYSVKALIREIVLSRAYGMATTGNEAWATRDPDNRHLWRQNRRRLRAEALRDGMLYLSGQLDSTRVDGVVDSFSEQAIDNNGGITGKVDVEAMRCRSVYLPLVRGVMPAMLEVFNGADGETVTGRRSLTTVPGQALLLMNSSFARDCAARMAERVVGERAETRAVALFERVMARSPSEDEKAMLLGFIGDSEAPADWADLAQVLCASAGFQFLE
jgi:uncharacterized small protein (DUF1192 family)